MNRLETGHYYEKIATEYLISNGYDILERNYRFHRAEIDIIAMDGACLVFIEVKYRKNRHVQHPLEAVDRHKQIQISEAASGYIYTRGYGDNVLCRFDIVAIDGEKITLYKDAFTYQNRRGW